MNPPRPAKKVPNADATQEYTGPIVEVVTDVSVELLPDVTLDGKPTPAMVAKAIARAHTLSPMAIVANRSPDASLEFPHPVSPELFADATDEFPDFDDELPPPREPPRWGYAAFTSVMVVAAIVIGLALGSRSRVSDDSTSTVTPAAQTKSVESKPAEPEAVAPPAATVDQKPAAPPMGTITSPKWAKGRPVFLDDQQIGLSGKLEAACGLHAVKIGPTGKARKVTVPCGGQIIVLP